LCATFIAGRLKDDWKPDLLPVAIHLITHTSDCLEMIIGNVDGIEADELIVPKLSAAELERMTTGEVQ
jgi:hypothetical protein